MLAKFTAGNGRIESTAGGWRLHIGPTSAYTDAQLDDTQGRPRRDLLHRHPVRLSLEARASAPSPRGTLGFGFWNDPFPSWAGEAGARRILPASPRALWFFHASSPSQIPFSPAGPMVGWAAASYRGPSLPGGVIAAMGAAALAGMAIPRLRAPLLRRYWRWFAGHQSPPLSGLDEWHAYEIDWRAQGAQFLVDGQTVLEDPRPSRVPLGLVIWIDNQWAALSQATGLRFGVLLSAEPAWLEIRDLRLNGRPIDVADKGGHR